jgi:hypothetical protein
MMRGKYHRKGFECLGVLERFEVTEPTKTASGQLTEVECGQGLGVE